jgi:uncharacterized membrane-anchored protein YitT (DUF2179 family)
MLSIIRSLHVTFNWPAVRDYLLIGLGGLLQALALRLFLVPSHLASGGVSGLAQIINYYTQFPIGVMVLLGNIPIFALGWRYLGGLRFAVRTALAVVTFALFTDLLVPFLPAAGLTHDLVLNSLYGALASGIGYGLVYRGQGTSGGTDILARILNHWRAVPIAQSYLMTDALIILLAGLSFGWTNALYALVALYVSGLAAESTTSGSNVVRTALIVTNQPQAVMDQILYKMERGVTVVSGRGGFTGAERTVLYCVVSRSEIGQMKTLVQEADPQAFVVIGQAHEVLGEGFRPIQG